MKHWNYLALFATIALLFPLSAFARNRNSHSVNFFDPVKIGNTQLKAGDYKVEWQGAGPAVNVTFLQNGKTVATAPATLQTNNSRITDDDVVLDASKTNAKAKALRELDFAHQRASLVFTQGTQGGM